MSRREENTGFICAKCGKAVTALTNGSYRNHCPHCLYSLHVDNSPGDRANDCLGLMKPIEVIYTSKKGMQIVHQCLHCGTKKSNKIAEFTDMPDDFDRIVTLMQECI